MSPTTLIILITVTGIVAVGLAVRGVIRRELSAITDSGGLDTSGGHFKELMDRLGEIERISKAVDALRMGLTNVKIRGGWGEVQLELILQDMLTENQYEKNVETVPGSNRRVEFAVMLPGRGGQKPVWLPIDSKFPLEDYLRLQAAMDAGDARALKIYDAIGIYLGYSLAHYAEFYDYEYVLLLGRVTSGPGGEHIIERSKEVMAAEFLELAERIKFHIPDEMEKRHGQAIAAASLPKIG